MSSPSLFTSLIFCRGMHSQQRGQRLVLVRRDTVHRLRQLGRPAAGRRRGLRRRQPGRRLQPLGGSGLRRQARGLLQGTQRCGVRFWGLASPLGHRSRMSLLQKPHVTRPEPSGLISPVDAHCATGFLLSWGLFLIRK